MYDCDVSEQPDWLSFRLTDSAGNIVTDRYDTKYSTTKTNTGRGYLFFDNLPKGTYSFEHVSIGYPVSRSGNLTFKALSHGLKSAAYIYKK